MKILMYGWEFPPEISGGLGMACYGIVRELAKKNLDIKLILPKSMENLTRSDRVLIRGCEEVEVASTEKWMKKLNRMLEWHEIETLFYPYITEEFYHQHLLHLEQEQQFSNHYKTKQKIALTGKYGPNLFEEVLRYAMASSEFAKKLSHDVIHAHDWLTGLAGVEAKKSSGKPLVFQVHALEYDRSGEYVNQRVRDIEQYSMDQADCIVSVSQYTKNMIVNRYGIAAEKIHVVYNGTDPIKHIGNRPKKKAKTKMVLFVGRMALQKGPWHFMQMAKKILSVREDVEFVIAGTGHLLKETIEQVAGLQYGRKMHFTGFLTQVKLQALYRLADVYVMPSVSEPFGLTCLEALSQGIPVVISKQSGASEVLPNVLTANFWDEEDMANKVLALLDHRALRESSLNFSANDLKQLTWGNTAENLIEVYRGLL